MKIETILVPVDFSDTSEKALRYAVTVAGRFRAKIALLHVVVPLPYPVEMSLVRDGVDLALGPARKKLAVLEKKFIPGPIEKFRSFAWGLPTR